MTKDDIMKLAREAGLPMAWISNSGVLTWTDLKAFANLVAAVEREACAKLCEEEEELRDHTPFDCALRIRARGTI